MTHTMDKTNGTAIEPGMIARLGRKLRNTLGVWFGPDQPQPLSAPAGMPPRTTDYPVSYNINIQPRNLEAISFAQMRRLADSFDLLRPCIATRKDQVSRMPWSFRVKRKSNESRASYAQRNSGHPRLQALSDFFCYPD